MRLLGHFAIAVFVASVPRIAFPSCETDRFTLMVDLAPSTLVGTHFNWFLAGADRERGAAVGMLEPLFAIDPLTGKRIGWLATELEWVDKPSVFRLHLRPNVKWSDGKPFGAEDVEFSLRLAMETAGLDGLHAARIRAAVKDVFVEDRRHLRITLAEGQETFVEDVLTAGESDAFAIVQAASWKEVDPLSSNIPPPVGTGPYFLANRIEDVIEWRRNPNWWGAKSGWHSMPVPEKLVWRTIAADEIRAIRLTRGCSDVMTGASDGIAAGILEVAPKISTSAGHQRWLFSPAHWLGLITSDPAEMDGFRKQSAQWVLYGLQSANEKSLTLRR